MTADGPRSFWLLRLHGGAVTGERPQEGALLMSRRGGYIFWYSLFFSSHGAQCHSVRVQLNFSFIYLCIYFNERAFLEFLFSKRQVASKSVKVMSCLQCIQKQCSWITSATSSPALAEAKFLARRCTSLSLSRNEFYLVGQQMAAFHPDSNPALIDVPQPKVLVGRSKSPPRFNRKEFHQSTHRWMTGSFWSGRGNAMQYIYTQERKKL